MIYDTRPEELFAAICERHNYHAERLITRTGAAGTFFEYRIETADEVAIAAVGELVADKDDIARIALGAARAREGVHLLGSRARGVIRSAALNLREYRNEAIPLLIVLYDNVRTPQGRLAYPMYYLEACQIDAAMYGDGFTIPKLRGEPGEIEWIGDGCTMTSTDRTHISAVSVISDWDDQSLFLFHNCFAKIPFPTSVFNDAQCAHLEKRGAPYTDAWKWKRTK